MHGRRTATQTSSTKAEHEVRRANFLALKHALDAGKHLLAIKKLMRHGRWETWLKANFSNRIGLPGLYSSGQPDRSHAGRSTRTYRNHHRWVLRVIDCYDRDHTPPTVKSARELVEDFEKAREELRRTVHDLFGLDPTWREADTHIDHPSGLRRWSTDLGRVAAKVWQGVYRRATRYTADGYKKWKRRLDDEFSAMHHCDDKDSFVVRKPKARHSLAG